MALRFKHQGDTFLVEGNINSTTVVQFKNHLEFLLLYCKSLTINMDGVMAIDTSGMQVLKQLYNTSKIKNKKFSIVGKHSDTIYGDFKSLNFA
jgi:anti-anti-sigma regulatory factor